MLLIPDQLQKSSGAATLVTIRGPTKREGSRRASHTATLLGQRGLLSVLVRAASLIFLRLPSSHIQRGFHANPPPTPEHIQISQQRKRAAHCRCIPLGGAPPWPQAAPTATAKATSLHADRKLPRRSTASTSALACWRQLRRLDTSSPKSARVHGPHNVYAGRDRISNRSRGHGAMRRTRNTQTPPRAIRRWRLFGSTPFLCVVIVLTLMVVSIARHPSSLQGEGKRLLWLDVALLLAYGIAAIWVRHGGSARAHVAIRLGSIAGLLLGAVLVVNHAIELFVSERNFALVISPVLLTLTLFGATGSAATERTGSLLMAVVAGVWCAMVGTLVLLCVGFVLELTLEARVEHWLREAFETSGMSRPRRVRRQKYA